MPVMVARTACMLILASGALTAAQDPSPRVLGGS
jgi:hypothetical protein